MAGPRNNQRRAAFAALYATNGGNGTQAAIDAGYAKKSAHSQASDLLKDPKVQEAIEAIKTKAANKAVITVARVVEELRDILTADLADGIDQDTGKLKPLHEWPVALRRALAGLDNEELTEWDADSRKHEVIGHLRKVKLWSKTDSARELLKHLPGGYAAQKIEHEVTVTTLASDLDAAQARLAAERK
jgi:phage terminase small subunit